MVFISVLLGIGAFIRGRSETPRRDVLSPCISTKLRLLRYCGDQLIHDSANVLYRYSAAIDRQIDSSNVAALVRS